jgi:signal-transduction protein with cAMP-binding, CBS, and nucleotidyltransferase domain
VLLVVSGTVEVRVADGAPTQVGAGEMVGLRALRAGAQHEEHAVVVADAEVLSVRIDVVDRLLSLPSVDRLLRRTRPGSATMSRRPLGVTVRVDGTGVAG